MKSLTKEQQAMVENNHQLIYWFLNKEKLSIEDFYDIVAIGLCKAAIDFDESKGFKFSTLAYRCMRNEVGSYLRSINAKGRAGNNHIISLDTTYFDEEEKIPLIDTISENDFDSLIENLADNNCNRKYENMVISRLGTLDLSLFTKKQSEVIKLLYKGLNKSEVAKILGCSKQNIDSYLKNIRKKIDKM